MIGINETRQSEPHCEAMSGTPSLRLVRSDGRFVIGKVLSQDCVRARLLLVVTLRIVVVLRRPRRRRPRPSGSKCSACSGSPGVVGPDQPRSHPVLDLFCRQVSDAGVNVVPGSARPRTCLSTA